MYLLPLNYYLSRFLSGPRFCIILTKYLHLGENKMDWLFKIMEKNMEFNFPTELGMSSLAVYRITVNGKLTKNWSERFSGVAVSLKHNSIGNPYTTLRCQIKDQSELLGILNWLCNLQLPLMQVTLEQVI